MAQEQPAAKRARTDGGDGVVDLDGESLTTEMLYSLSKGKLQIKLTDEARAHAGAGRAVVDKISKSGEVVYGINTGFGLFANVTVSNDQLSELQENLIRSHSSGVGAPLSREQSRMLLALRINVLAKGHSGISLEVLDQMIAAFNADCLPVVPSKGTVGASGDLAPLSHLALGLMGEGELWDPKKPGSRAPASQVLQAAGLRPIRLGAKEGLAMINGTQLIASLGSEAISRAEQIARTADVVCALTLEVLCGTVRAYHPLIHHVRPHSGQQEVARRVRALLQPEAPSELFKSHGYVGKVQDAYSLRCVPQVHGVVNDTIRFVQNLMNVELNSATDNPMVFTREQVDAAEPMGFNLGSPVLTAEPSPVKRSPSSQGSFMLEPAATESLKKAAEDLSPEKSLKPADASDVQSLDDARQEIAALRRSLAEKTPAKNWTFFKKPSDIRYNGDGGMILSGGNFHGEYPAKALDYLAIAVHELAAISERRIERLCNPSLSGLPAFLVKEGGLNSGFMIAHCTAAALVSENKVLTHPSSVDSISTSAAKEDHVSMGGFAARKALEVVEHVETVLAIELLAACQALEFHRPHRTTEPLEAVHALIRTKVAPWNKDRHMSPDIEAALQLVQSGAVLETAAAHLKATAVSDITVNGKAAAA
mmetsp:Transcript_100272/g.189100  ORF Transcript_100272/g.189100 Transcript_100272/m.189100 type:complete len:651 (-) Transcript_100272:53-2005(-)